MGCKSLVCGLAFELHLKMKDQCFTNGYSYFATEQLRDGWLSHIFFTNAAPNNYDQSPITWCLVRRIIQDFQEIMGIPTVWYLKPSDLWECGFL